MRSFRWILLLGFISMISATISACANPSDPWIEAIAPEEAAAGGVVDVIGEHFAGTDRGVSFGAVSAAVLFWGSSRVRVRVPIGAEGMTIVVVMVDGRPSNAFDFKVLKGSGGSP